MKYNNLFKVLLSSAMLLVGSSAAMAHHSQSGEFDRSLSIEFTGTVKGVEWTNPHGFVLIEVESDDGSVLVYRAEISAPNGLYRSGWRPNSVQAGTVVTFEGSPARNPDSMNVAGSIIMPDGVVAYRGSAPLAR
jgi:hypothetical protein